MKPNIELEIEELVLQGFPPGDRYRIGAAVQSERGRRLLQVRPPASFALGAQ